jgi:hypothetical protein
MVDRYTKIVLTVIALALAALALRPLLTPRIVTAGDFSGIPAESFLSDTDPRKVDVPRSWGRLVAASDRSLFFEASDGTIRNHPVTAVWTQWARK